MKQKWIVCVFISRPQGLQQLQLGGGASADDVAAASAVQRSNLHREEVSMKMGPMDTQLHQWDKFIGATGWCCVEAPLSRETVA